MKIGTIIPGSEKLHDKPEALIEDQETGSTVPSVEPVIFPASDRFKHMLSLIARDNPMLYNRIVNLE